MKKIVSIIILVFLAFSPLTVFSQKRKTSKKQKPTKRVEIVAELQPEDGSWKELTSVEGNFKVIFPKEPEKLVRKNNSTRGNSFIEYKLSTNFRRYSVSFGEFTKAKFLSSEQTAELYDVTRDGIIKDAKGKLLTDKSLEIGNITGREIIYEQENYIVTNRYFLSGNKFYQIITVAEKELNKGVNIQEFGKKFLDSFQFIN